MIRVTPAPEPTDFDATVRVPGLRAIAEMVGEKPRRSTGRRFANCADRREDIPGDAYPTYWTRSLDDLMAAYHRVCAYACFAIHPVTGAASVDHFAAKSRAWDRAYEWDNYRLACSRLNARKNDFSGLVDPFAVRDGWFELELVGFQVTPGGKTSGTTRAKIRRTIDALKLNSFCRARETDAENYWTREVSLRILTRESPFVANELRRQGRLNAEDC